MSASQRRKGRAAQTQGSQILTDAGWTVVDTSAGSAVEDCFAIAPDHTQFSVEITADQGISLAAKWGQTVRQADARGVEPMMLWRFDGQGWWVVIGADMAACFPPERDPWLRPAQHRHPRAVVRDWNRLGCVDPDVTPVFALAGGLSMAPADVIEEWWM